MEIYAKNVVLKGKEKKNVLADECDKKKLLDIVQQIKFSCPFEVYGYCILDNEARFLFHMPQESEEEILCGIADDFTAYYKLNREVRWDVVRKISADKTFKTEEKLRDSWLELHNLPVKKSYVRKAADYWWSSFRDYAGKSQSGIVNQEQMLNFLDKDILKARKKFSSYYKKR